MSLQKEAAEYVQSNSASVYINKVHERLQDEAERAKHYLDPSTESRIAEVVKRELVEKHMKTVVELENSGAVFMVENRKLGGEYSRYLPLVDPCFIA